MIPSLSIGPRTLLNDRNHSATSIFWRSDIVTIGCHVLSRYVRICVTNIDIVGPTVSSLNQKVVQQHANVTYLSRCFHICGYAGVTHSPAPFQNTEIVLNNDTR